ncbi:hypothetical protein V8C86DRAFT_2613935 [Haematococcus lacustris]
MNRRWQKDGQGRYDSLLSLNTVLGELPALERDLSIASLADVYAAYSALHAKGRCPAVAADVKRGVRFLTAETPPDVGVKHTGHQGSSCASGPVIEMVVPVNSRCQHVTPRLLHSLFFLDCSSSARKVTVAATAAGCLSSFVLAIADSDGSVTFSRLHWGLHPPQGGIQAMSAPGPEVEGDNLGDSDAD